MVHQATEVRLLFGLEAPSKFDLLRQPQVIYSPSKGFHPSDGAPRIVGAWGSTMKKHGFSDKINKIWHLGLGL